VLDYLIIAGAGVCVAALTFFSGFGVGTLLLPVFALFFPLDIAIGATAVVHLANNLFKLALVGKDANRSVVIRFALPAMLAAVAGAMLLVSAERTVSAEPLATIAFAGLTLEPTILRVVIGSLIIAFAFLDLAPKLQNITLSRKHAWAGGVVSGFFGGLSGHQGAARTTVLTKLGLSRDELVGTSVVSSVLVDITRLAVYALGFVVAGSGKFENAGEAIAPLVITGCVATFAGSYIGARLVKKVTITTLRKCIGVLLILAGLAMAIGLI
jgi:hypothetical protein